MNSNSGLKITFFGTGTSQGVPIIGCDCNVCRSSDPLNKRLRSSIFIETQKIRLLVDTTPDFRFQCLRSDIRHLDAILYTHEHSDHILGLDDLRRFCFLHQKRLPAYGSARVIEYITRIFPYAIQNPPPYKGIPELDLHEICGPFKLGDLQITPYKLPHGYTETLGFRFDNEQGPRFVYLTDCKEVPPSIRKNLYRVPLLILDALRKTSHPTHLSLAEALEVVDEIKPGRALFTHICHELEHHATNAELPPNVSLSYDGQIVEV